ncbi:DUF1573 domain-containing protein [Candidatus Poribacteria bacterium]|nr:DUF1573 domain-containing protein [Candidatus Poribacteria bacterium]
MILRVPDRLCLCVAIWLLLLLPSCSNKSRYENARLSIEPDKADFGTIQAGDPIAFRDVSLTAKNLGSLPLEIEKIELPEGFTYSIAPSNVIEAGDSASVKIMIDTRKLTAPVSGTAYVLSNDPAQPRLPITLEAKITSKGATQDPGGGNEPNIEFDHRAFDFGPIPRNEMFEHSFAFKNTGKKSLMIYSIKTLCICASGKPTAAQVPPGGSAAIIARVEPYKYDGTSPRKSLMVETNDPDEPVINLMVSATIIQPVSLEPEVVLLPGVRLGQKAQAEAKLLQKASEKLIIKGIKTSSPRISVATSPLEGNQEGYLLKITLAPDMPVGKFEEMITISTNYQSFPAGAEKDQGALKRRKDYSTLQLPVKGAVTGAVSVAPEKVNFGYGTPGKPIRRKLVVSGLGSSFDIQSLTLADPSFHVSYAAVEPGKKFEITIEFLPGSAEQQIESTLIIKTSESVLEVPVYAAVKFNS